MSIFEEETNFSLFDGLDSEWSHRGQALLAIMKAA